MSSNSSPPGERPPPPRRPRRPLRSRCGSGDGIADSLAPIVGEVRKILSPQMMGVPPLHAGSGVFQTIFSDPLHVVGKFLASLTPFW